MKLSEIASLIGGTLEGKDTDITGVSDLDEQFPGTIAFADNKKNLEKLISTAVAALILPAELTCTEKPVIRVTSPKFAFLKVLEKFSPYRDHKKETYPNVYIEKTAKIGKNPSILPFAVIMDNAVIGDDAVIYSHVYIGRDVKIGNHCVLKAGVVIDDGTVIGDNCIIHHNTVVGGDGYGYIQKDGRNIKVPQIGRIVIGNDVELGAGVTIDRATMGETVIGNGVKVDNLVQIAHNVKIGDDSIIISQVGIGGSSTIGKNCFLTGQVGIADHVTIGDGVVLLAQSGVESKQVIESGKFFFGTPAREMMPQKRIYAAMERLPQALKTLNIMKKKLGIEDNDGK